jgi:signal transduction histidine kinase/CheY-like chemotaxis protein
VTNQIVMLTVPGRDEPLPVLLNFLPVHVRDEHDEPRVRAVTVTGEVLAEPASWTENQTQRHRMETLGRMTMGIAHDFNNLLSGILGYTELMRSEAAERESDERLASHLRTVEQAALDGAALVRKIQQYIREEKEKRYESVNVNVMIEDCIAFTKPYWYNEPRRQGIAIEVDTDLRADVPVSGAPAELREVFINLILNAVQAMPFGGRISFSTRHEPERGVTIVVRDTGTGMSEDVRQRIFEPLFTTKGQHGTGMGLAVSYGIIQEHEGSISVESAPNEGTTFLIVLPPAEAVVEVGLDSRESAPQRSARILVVDDETMVRSVLSKLLTLKGHQVTVAASGAEAIVLMESEEFDVVFTDHGMPEMSGRQLAKALRRRFPSLPIVLLTGDTDAGKADEDVNVVLSKPFMIDDLNATIQDLI